MIVSRFLLWARDAPPGDRVEAVTALAQAFLHSDLTPDNRWEARMALTAMLDDPSALVRRAMAVVLASSPEAPRPIVVALADDQDDIAEIVLARSPVLSDADLVDRAALGAERLQCAIATRPWLSTSVSAALAEIGTPDALLRLARNEGAEITGASLARMIERHGGSGLLREALLVRPDLPVEITQAIVAALAESLGGFVTGCGWLSAERSGRITRDARERTTVALSVSAECEDAERLVRHLRRSAQLTPALILRAILSRATPFAAAAFAELSGLASARVAAILQDARGYAFRALYGRSGLPENLRPAFEAALCARREVGDPDGPARLSGWMVERALAACEALPPEDAGRLVALLRRFEVEAARDEARREAYGLADQAALALVMEHAPEMLVPHGRWAA
ncbi:DUF2336 domain-containing protein [uncultured Enterovirga sp.]|uniref:DUF2336 domain-containing protein n=1 Tax=uncultured Enterovirga sp. TaxID=2026352 RepID=UPI0035CC329E